MDKEINNNGFDYVDLGLPSGTLWATCNVGASKPSEYGLYFQWGDTKGYTAKQVETDKQFTWEDYKFNPSGDGKTFTKYANPCDKLELEDDAAHIHMGGDWHMPTPTQIRELIENTTSTWATQDGVNGKLFISRKDCSKSIFIPAVGGAWDVLVEYCNIIGSIWSSTLSLYNFYYGQRLYFDSGDVNLGSYYRCDGLSVRGVIDNNNLKKNKLCRLIQKLIRFTSVFKILEK